MTEKIRVCTTAWPCVKNLIILPIAVEKCRIISWSRIVCVVSLQEASLRSWRSTTTSHGRRLTWPLEKATSCRLSTTRKSRKPSASSSAALSYATASQRREGNRFAGAHVTAAEYTRARVNEHSRSGWLWLRLQIPSICWLKRWQGWHLTNASCSCHRHQL